MKAYTDYPFNKLGDESFKPAPIREIELLSYDGDKYVTLKVEGVISSIKRGYVYTKPGRWGEVPSISTKDLSKLKETTYD